MWTGFMILGPLVLGLDLAKQVVSESGHPNNEVIGCRSSKREDAALYWFTQERE
jgi:hypothetical protein